VDVTGARYYREEAAKLTLCNLRRGSGLESLVCVNGIRMRIILAFLVAGAATLGWMYIRFGTDAIPYVMSVLIGYEDTVYSPQYSEKRFQEVNSGMSEVEVLRLLGPPLLRSIHCRGGERRIIVWLDGKVEHDYTRQTDEPLNDCRPGEKDNENWVYARQGNPTSNYFYRMVHFSASGEVVEKVAAFDID